MERLLFVALLGAAAVAIADGPGTRLLTSPEMPKPGVSPGPDQARQRCEALRDEQKARCLKDLQSARARSAGGGAR